MKAQDIFQKIEQKLNFSYETENPNYEFLVKIFNEDFLRKNYNNALKLKEPKETIDKSSNSKSKNKAPNNPYDNLELIINPKIERINDYHNNEVFLFTYDYLLKNGLLLTLSENYFRGVLYKFQKTLNTAINEINTNIRNLDQIANNYGVEFINDLSILYAKIKDIHSFILSTQLYGEAKSMDLNNIIAGSISNVSSNTSDIVGQCYEDNVLLYFLNNSNINAENVLPRVFFYIDFIIFKYANKKINIEFIPFNLLFTDKTENYNEMDFSFYTKKNIQIPMSSMKYQIFTNTLIYNHKEDVQVKNYNNNEIIFPENTLTFFEMKNNISRIQGKKSINLEDLISKIRTFLSKLPIYMKLYKSKNFINENCNNIKFIFFYDHQNGKIDDPKRAKDLIKKEIDNRFKNNVDINIDIQIIFGSKQIQSINYFNLFLENNNTKEQLNQTKKELDNTNEELNQTKKKLNNTNEELNQTKKELNNTNEELKQTNIKVTKLEEELESMKKILNNRNPNNINECVEFEKEKEEIIELEETKININKEIDNYKKNFKGIKLKIFEKAIDMLNSGEYINKDKELIKLIQSLSEKLTAKKFTNICFDTNFIKKKASQLIKTIIKKNN